MRQMKTRITDGNLCEGQRYQWVENNNEHIESIGAIGAVEAGSQTMHRDARHYEVSTNSTTPSWIPAPKLVRKERKLGAHAMKRVGAHLPTPWLFEPAKRPDDRADYCLGSRR